MFVSLLCLYKSNSSEAPKSEPLPSIWVLPPIFVGPFFSFHSNSGTQIRAPTPVDPTCQSLLFCFLVSSFFVSTQRSYRSSSS